MATGGTITATYNGKPLAVLQDLIRARSVYLHQTMDKAADATAVTVLKSLRVLTKVAKLAAKKAQLQRENNLYIGFIGVKGKQRTNNQACIRYRGGQRFTPKASERVVHFPDEVMANPKAAHVYSCFLWNGDKRRKYYIAALTKGAA